MVLEEQYYQLQSPVLQTATSREQLGLVSKTSSRCSSRRVCRSCVFLP